MGEPLSRSFVITAEGLMASQLPSLGDMHTKDSFFNAYANTAQESAKAEGVRPDRSQNGAASRQTSEADAASISGMAAALSPSESTPKRPLAERGQYNPSANDVAAKLIDEHSLDQ